MVSMLTGIAVVAVTYRDQRLIPYNGSSCIVNLLLAMANRHISTPSMDLESFPRVSPGMYVTSTSFVADVTCLLQIKPRST